MRSLIGGAAVVVAMAVLRAAYGGGVVEGKRTLELEGGGELKYAMLVPVGLDVRHDPVPVLLALPPGAQDEGMVEAGLARYFRVMAAEHGWVVVSPVAPGGRLFYRTDNSALIELMDEVAGEVNVEGGKFHLAGVSNGGLSAFHLAVDEPERILSVCALPGMPMDERDAGMLGALAGIPVAMFGGARDGRWVDGMRAAEERMKEAGVEVSVKVFVGQGHLVEFEEGELEGVLESRRIGGGNDEGEARHDGVVGDAEAAIGTVLDDLHKAASESDLERYFSHFAPEAVFLGTDATGVAAFDELLENEGLGQCRGSGMMRVVGGEWKVALYDLSIPVPNDLAGEVVEVIRGGQE